MKRIVDDIKNFKGNVVTIEVEDNKIKKSLEKNNKINVIELNRPKKRKIFFFK